MKDLIKTISIFSAVVFLLSSNFCAVECAFASEEHHHSPASCSIEHHHESGHDKNHSGSDEHKHDAGFLCCSSLLVVKNVSDNSTVEELAKNSFSKIVVLENIIHESNNPSKYEVEFPPGTSPPGFFLLAHFTHGPPAL